MSDETIIAALQQLHDAFNEPLDFRVKGDKVFERAHNTGRGAGSGIEVDFVTYIVWTLDDHGLVKEVQAFLPHEEAEALEAAGLKE